MYAKKIKQKKNKHQRGTIARGSILILALVMASILLSVGMGISNIAMKEIKLTSIGNESGKAFYMADTAAECALYWDVKNPYLTDPSYPLLSVFPTSSQSTLPDLTDNPVRCLGFDFWQQDYPPPPPEFCFNGNCEPPGDPIRKRYGHALSASPRGGWYIEYDNAGSASVEAATTFILKSSLTDDSQPCAVVVVTKRDTGSGIFTTIDSRGRSSCDNNPRRVERGLKVSY